MAPQSRRGKLRSKFRCGVRIAIPTSKPSLQKSATTTHACRLRVKLNGICSSYLMSGPRLKTEGRTRAERHLQLLDPDGDRPEAVCGPSGRTRMRREMILMHRCRPTRAARARPTFYRRCRDLEAWPEPWERRSKTKHSIDD